MRHNFELEQEDQDWLIGDHPSCQISWVEICALFLLKWRDWRLKCLDDSWSIVKNLNGHYICWRNLGRIWCQSRGQAYSCSHFSKPIWCRLTPCWQFMTYCQYWFAEWLFVKGSYPTWPITHNWWLGCNQRSSSWLWKSSEVSVRQCLCVVTMLYLFSSLDLCLIGWFVSASILRGHMLRPLELHRG